MSFPASPCWMPPGSGYEGRLNIYSYWCHGQGFEAYSGITRLHSIDIWGSWGPPGCQSLGPVGRVGALWVRSRGPVTDNPVPWSSYHWLSPNEYQWFYNYWTARGYQPSRICASGTEEGANRFACIFVEDGVHAYGKHNQTREQFMAELLRARRNDYVLESVSVHTENGKRFHSVWRKNVNDVEWQLILDESSSRYQSSFDTITAGGWRPTYVTVCKDGPDRYTAVFQKPFPHAWAAYHDVPLAAHEAHADSLIERCYRPLHVARGTSNYAGVWIRSPIP